MCSTVRPPIERVSCQSINVLELQIAAWYEYRSEIWPCIHLSANLTFPFSRHCIHHMTVPPCLPIVRCEITVTLVHDSHLELKQDISTIGHNDQGSPSGSVLDSNVASQEYHLSLISRCTNMNRDMLYHPRLQVPEPKLPHIHVYGLLVLLLLILAPASTSHGPKPIHSSPSPSSRLFLDPTSPSRSV